MSLDDLARASCVVCVGGRRLGTGTLVTDARVLTAAHVLQREGPVTIRFRDELSGVAIPVERLPLGADADEFDVAVLTLPRDVGRPPPATLWPTRRLPLRTKAFGYPTHEGAAPRGVWRDSAVAGAVQGGRAQLDWRDVGSLEGHSGGPVCDRLSGLMVGVLVEGSDAGHFDRMVTLGAIRRVWDGLPRPWLFAGDNAQTHFGQRAAGRQSIARGGDLFRGRREALTMVRDWLCAGEGPGIPLVITAQPGAGKSAVLARAVLDIERGGRYDGVAFHARHAAVADLVDAVSAACGLDTPASWQELAARLTDEEARDVLVLAVDALDEAASDWDRAELRQAIRELARLDWLRVAVATRQLATGNPYRPGTHLHNLGVTAGAASRNLIDLDTGRFFAFGDLIAYADSLLAQDGFAKPGPPGGAWVHYRQNDALRARLACVVAARAGRNYLVAGMSAFQLAEEDTVIDPASPLFDASAVPGGIGEALRKYLVSLPGEKRRQAAGLLTALAYGRGPGLDDNRWLAFARALGDEDVTVGDILELRISAAADYLLETSAERGERVTRLFHQALVDELVCGRDRRADEARLIQLLRAEGGDRGWLASAAYARMHAPSHAFDAGVLRHLIREPDFLIGMSPAAMRPVVRGLMASSYQDPVAVYDAALPFLGNEPGVNAAILELVSRAQGNRALSKALAEVLVNRPYKVSGHLRPFDRAMDCFDGHTREVWGVAVLDWPDLDHPAVITTSRDGTARVWDPCEPGRELARLEGHMGWVRGVAALGWPGLGHLAVVTTSDDGTARVWDPREPGRELARFEGHTDAVVGVAVLDWPELDHQVVVTTSDDGTARVWDPRDRCRELARFEGHTSHVTGVAALDWPDLDHPVVVTTCVDATARVWDPREPSRELARFDRHTSQVWRAAGLDWPDLDHPAVVTTSRDGTARVWDPRDPGRELARFEGHTDGVVGVAALDWPGLDHPVLVTTSDDGTARVWDPRDPGRELAHFDGHTGTVLGVAAFALQGVDHPVLVTTSRDRTARVWDLCDPDREPADFEGHTGRVNGLAAVDWPGLDHRVLVTTSTDQTARVWDPRDPGRELAHFDGHTCAVEGVAALNWPGLDHPVLVTTSRDRTARVWDPHDPGRELARFDGHTGEVLGVVALDWPGLDHPVLVTTSRDRTARVWDPHDPGRELARFDGHTGEVWAGLAVLGWPGLDHPAVVTTSWDRTARVWDPREPGRELARFEGHTRGVEGVAALDWPSLDHPAVVTTSADATARVWDPREPGRELARFEGHTGRVTGVVALDWPGLDHPAVVTTSHDGTARVWDPDPFNPNELLRLQLLGEGHSITVLDPLTLAITSSRGFLVFELT